MIKKTKAQKDELFFQGYTEMTELRVGPESGPT